jgi:putative nucleotidyltransferase with HDIG domain
MSHSTLNQIAQQEKIRREILHKSDLIPPLPDLVAKLLGLLNKKDAEPSGIALLLQNDQVLVAKMLAMVNSPFYGLNRTIRTIKEAVMVLGFRGVRSLVLATSAAKYLQRDFACYGHQPRGLWVHAVCVAAGSRQIAQACQSTPDEAEQLFVAGLLHDIGKMLLVTYLDEGGIAPVIGSVCECERAKVGLDHTEAGAMVIARWNLAPEIQTIMKAHHGGEDPALARSIAVVRLADAVAHEVEAGYHPGRAPASNVRPGDLAALGLQPAAWATLHDQVVATMAEATQTLGDFSS